MGSGNSRGRAGRFLAVLIGAASIGTDVNARSDPAVCTTRVTTATGQEAPSPRRARENSQAAWLRKVSRDRTLGPPYAVWAQARNPRTVCRRLDTQTICLAAATPCRAA
jgi:hypothetical protein